MVQFTSQRTSHQECRRKITTSFHSSVSHGGGQIFGLHDKPETPTKVSVLIVVPSFMDETYFQKFRSLYYEQGFCWYQSVLETLLLLSFILNFQQNPFPSIKLEAPIIVAVILFIPRLFLFGAESHEYIYTIRSLLSLASFVLINLQLLLIIDIGYIPAILIQSASCTLSIPEIGLFLHNRHFKKSTDVDRHRYFVLVVALYAISNEITAILCAALLDFPNKFSRWIIASFFMLPRFITSASDLLRMKQKHECFPDRILLVFLLLILGLDMISASLLAVSTDIPFMIYALVVKCFGLAATFLRSLILFFLSSNTEAESLEYLS